MIFAEGQKVYQGRVPCPLGGAGGWVPVKMRQLASVDHWLQNTQREVTRLPQWRSTGTRGESHLAYDSAAALPCQ